jgi:hypothetical protein
MKCLTKQIEKYSWKPKEMALDDLYTSNNHKMFLVASKKKRIQLPSWHPTNFRA